MSDFIGDFVSAACDIAHELKVAVGTGFTILGSRLEARARARVECGPQWLTEFEEQRDSLAPAEVCEFHGPWCAGEASWCHHLKDSAAVSAAADPSPTVPNAHSVVGDCPGSDSVILPTVEPGPQTSHPPSYQEAVSEAHPRNHVWLWEYDASGRSCKLCGYVERSFPVPLVVAGESPSRADASVPPGGSAQTCSSGGRADAGLADLLYEAAVGLEWFIGLDGSRPPVERCQRLITELRDHAGSMEANNPTKPVSHEDLAAHLIGAAIRANTGHVDVLVEAFASSLLADFNITKK